MRILLVEDEKKLSEALVNILKREKYEVDAAYDGEDGLYYALANIYDIIILDVLMPKKNGWEVLKELRMKKITTPVLMLTALADTSDKIQGLDLGADDYLAKPFSVPELLARIRALLRRKGSLISDNTLKYGNTVLSLSSYLLSSNYTSIKLSVKEFEIMRYFFENSSFVAEKESMISRVWGLDNDFESNNLEVYISFIRKKLQHIKANYTIETIRGVGYRLGEIADE